jgi:hypothetical protein
MGTGVASANPGDTTVTQISATPNPSSSGDSVTISVLECDDTTDLVATGTMTVVDQTTGTTLGVLTLGASSFVNCGGASLSISTLAVGEHTITATYTPGGSTPVPGSPPTSYTQQVNGSTVTFTQVSGSPNPTSVGGPFVVTALECDRDVDVQATGSITFTDTTTGVVLGTEALGSSSYVNCGSAQVTDSESLAAGTYKIKAAYKPGGADPIAKSTGTYKETVKGLAFTDISWTTGAPIPDPHFEGTVATVGGQIYDLGGSTADCSDGDGCNPQLNVNVYNPKTNSWRKAAALPNDHQDTPVSTVVGGDIYVIGGSSGQNEVDVYNPGSNSWTTLPASSDLPATINTAWSCGVSVGSNVYIFTVYGIGVMDTSVSPPTWTVLPASPLLSPSDFCDATLVGPNNPTSTAAQVVITGPGDGSSDASSQRVLVFSPASDSLILAGATTVPMAEHSTTTIDGNAVVAGGDFSPEAVQYIPPGFSTAVSISNLPQPRDDAEGGVQVSGKLYITGGGENGETPAGGVDVLIGTPN